MEWRCKKSSGGREAIIELGLEKWDVTGFIQFTFSIGSYMVLKYQKKSANHKVSSDLCLSIWSIVGNEPNEIINPEIDTLSIDDLYNNLRVFEQEIKVLASLLLDPRSSKGGQHDGKKDKRFSYQHQKPGECKEKNKMEFVNNVMDLVDAHHENSFEADIRKIKKNWNDMMERELGEGYSFTKKKYFVCGSLSHFIKDCDYYEKKMAREAEVKRVVNTVRSRQPVPHKISNSVSPKRPQMNQINQRRDFSKSYSSVRRPFAKTTAQMSHSNAVMGSWGSAVKTSASYNWRNTRPKFHYNSGPTFNRIVNAKGPQGRPKPVKA
ncbi:hypothetical protein Tco_1061217 [Tanacetum coccineum]